MVCRPAFKRRGRSGDEPKFITEIARSGNPQDDHGLAFEYDNGGPLTLGKLTKITEAPGTAVQQVRTLVYQSPDGDWGLPTAVTNEVGGQTVLDYDDSTGQLLKTTSPQNLVQNTGDPAASVTMLAYTADGLPRLVQDPMGHQIQIGYAPDPANPANLVVTATFNDSSTQTATVDPKGRIVQAVDEKNVVTAWTYNPAGQVKSITRDAMDPDPSQRRTTLFSYDDQGNLRYFDPPLGVMGRVQFEYVRYTLNGNNPPVLDGHYQGEVTHITYPDGRSEYFGYNDAGELAWERKGSGAVIQISGRDGQHRVTRIDYPAEGASFSFSTTTTFDEFGRPVASTDRQGTTQRFFDLLDRPAQVLPPSPQAALTFSYTPDTALQRWITTVTAAGVGSYVYKEDTKGRLADLVNPFSQTFHQEYDLDGKPTLTQFPSGIQEVRGYTPRDWLSMMQVQDALGNPLKTLQDLYTDAQNDYDPTGHLQREREGAGDSGPTHAFFYNAHYELKEETLPDGTDLKYGLDANGNRTSVTTNGVTDYYGVDGANKLLWVNRSTDPHLAPTPGQGSPYTIFGYDADGRVSSRDRFDTYGLRRIVNLTWDSDDRLQQVTSGTDSLLSATYTGDGERVSETDLWTGLHNYSWGPGGILSESNEQSGPTTYTPGFGQRQGSDPNTDLTVGARKEVVFFEGMEVRAARNLSEGLRDLCVFVVQTPVFAPERQPPAIRR